MMTKETFDEYDSTARAGLLALQELIFEVAEGLPEIGRIECARRWGQAAYITPETKAGSTIRLGVPKSGGFALFVICSTSLIEDFKPIAPANMRFEGTRAVLFHDISDIDAPAMRLLIARALTYHLKS